MAALSLSELILQRCEWKRNGKRVVCVTGVFDLLHPGHIRLLEQARVLGDVLVVAVRSDAHAREQKGAGRPVTAAAERAEIVAALAAVDIVVELTDDPSAKKFVEEFAPDVLVQASGTSSKKPGRTQHDPASTPGVKLIQIPPEPGHSTSLLIERVKQLRA